MGFLGIDSNSSSASDSRIAAGDQSKIIRGSVGAYTEAGALSVGTNARYLSPGAAEISGINAKGDIKISTSDPAVTESALAAVTQLAQQNASAQAATVNGALGQLSDLTQTAQTGGASLAADTIKKILLWGLGIIAVGILGVVFFRSRKKA